MILYTIRNQSEINQLNSLGELITDPTRIENDWKFQYKWMTGKLNQKVQCPANIRYPLWAWVKKPQQDEIIGGYDSSCGLFLITFEINEDEILTSSFDEWNDCLNTWYISESEEEHDLFESQDLTQEEKQREIVKSWEKIFNENLTRDGDWLLKDPSIQAVFWKLKKNQIIKIERIK